MVLLQELVVTTKKIQKAWVSAGISGKFHSPQSMPCFSSSRTLAPMPSRGRRYPFAGCRGGVSEANHH